MCFGAFLDLSVCNHRTAQAVTGFICGFLVPLNPWNKDQTRQLSAQPVPSTLSSAINGQPFKSHVVMHDYLTYILVIYKLKTRQWITLGISNFPLDCLSLSPVVDRKIKATFIVIFPPFCLNYLYLYDKKIICSLVLTCSYLKLTTEYIQF